MINWWHELLCRIGRHYCLQHDCPGVVTRKPAAPQPPAAAPVIGIDRAKDGDCTVRGFKCTKCGCVNVTSVERVPPAASSPSAGSVPLLTAELAHELCCDFEEYVPWDLRKYEALEAIKLGRAVVIAPNKERGNG